MADPRDDDYYDDDAEEYEDIGFECAAYPVEGGMYCPLQGSEDCDWECPEGGWTRVCLPGRKRRRARG